jgi:RNA polymerase sigma-70 factor (ECF subfamily)
MPSPAHDSQPSPFIEGIATDSLIFRDPGKFFLRYAPAIQGYFGSFIKNPEDAEDAAQDFFLRIMRRGFPGFAAARGRFRDYLKTAIRNAARSYMQRHRRRLNDSLALALLCPAPESELALDQQFIAYWRWCLVKRAWAALRQYQDSWPGNLFHTVLRLKVRYPEHDSVKLAARASALVGYPIQAAAYRKQVSRARRLLAELLVREVRTTLHDPSPEELEQELIDLGLWNRIRRAFI